jgi:hypothetical protein
MELDSDHMERRRRLFLQQIAALVPAAYKTWATAQPVRHFELKIVGRRLAGETTIRVNQGDRVELRWTSDEAATLHLHGYNIEIAVTPTAPAQLRFDARLAGRFPMAAHDFGRSSQQSEARRHRETALLYIEVLPR